MHDVEISFYLQLLLQFPNEVGFLVLHNLGLIAVAEFWHRFLAQVDCNVVFKLLDVLLSLCQLFLSLFQ